MPPVLNVLRMVSRPLPPGSTALGWKQSVPLAFAVPVVEMKTVIGASAKAGLAMGAVNNALSAKMDIKRFFVDVITGPPFQWVEVSHTSALCAVGDWRGNGKELVRNSPETALIDGFDLHSTGESANNSVSTQGSRVITPL